MRSLLVRVLTTGYSSTVQIVKLIVFLAVPNGQAWILMNWVSSKAYINSIFAMCVP